jgi:hypothetical protein
MQEFINRHTSLQTDDWPDCAGADTPVDFFPICVPQIMGEAGLNEFYSLHSNYQEARRLYGQFADRFHTKTGPFSYQEVCELDSMLREIDIGDVEGLFGALGRKPRRSVYRQVRDGITTFEQRIAEMVYNSGRPVFYDQIVRPVTRQDRLLWRGEHSRQGLLEELCWMHFDVLENFLQPLHQYLFYECAGHLQGEDLVLMPFTYTLRVAGKDNYGKDIIMRLGPMREAVRRMVPRELNLGRIADNITQYCHKFVGGQTTGIFGRYRPVVENRMDFRQQDIWCNSDLRTRDEYLASGRETVSPQ